jgi:hypothetical protein
VTLNEKLGTVILGTDEVVNNQVTYEADQNTDSCSDELVTVIPSTDEGEVVNDESADESAESIDMRPVISSIFNFISESEYSNLSFQFPRLQVSNLSLV